MFSDVSLTTVMTKSSQTWKRFADKTLQVLQIHSHSEEVECLTCQEIDKQILPNKALCFVITSAHNNNHPNLEMKFMKNSLKFEVDNQPQDYLFTNILNEQPYHSKPFLLHEALISTKQIVIGRPPIPLHNVSGNDCYAISGMCYFTNTYIDQIYLII